MISNDGLFGNHFNNKNIISPRLVDFGAAFKAALQAGNESGDFTALIALLDTALDDLSEELGGVDVALAVQKGKTQTVDQFMEGFKEIMSEKEGVIADKLGGRDTEAYMAFYPHGISEYTSASKTQMPVLVNRIFEAADAHKTALGDPLADLLKAFEGTWETVRTAQVDQMGTVDNNRGDRTDKRIAAELALTVGIHTVAIKFPGDVEACSAFFDFSLLYSVTRHDIDRFPGTIAPGGMVVVFNKTLTDSMSLDIKNLSENSNLHAFLGATATSLPAGDGVTINATRGKRPKPGKVGDLANPFFILKNMSDVNEASYLVILRS